MLLTWRGVLSWWVITTFAKASLTRGGKLSGGGKHSLGYTAPNNPNKRSPPHEHQAARTRARAGRLRTLYDNHPEWRPTLRSHVLLANGEPACSIVGGLYGEIREYAHAPEPAEEVAMLFDGKQANTLLG